MFAVTQGSFLVVDDDLLVVGSLSRVLAAFGSVATALSREAAREHLRSRPEWSGFVFDWRLRDGSGLDLLSEARQIHPFAPAILLSGAMDPEAVNGAFELGARCLCKPCPTACLRKFAHEALAANRQIPERITRAVGDLATKHALSPAQTEILFAAVQGIDRASIVATRRVSENTHKTQVRGILRKTRTLSLGELRDQVLRSVAGAA